jgi:S-phase kinase-associated protein 1
MASTVAFTSADGVNIAVERDYIVECGALYTDHWRSLVADPAGAGDVNKPIQIPNVDGSVLKKVAEWCDHHQSDACDQPNAGAGDEDEDSGKTTAEWDKKFMQEINDREMLLQLIIAANFLGIKPLHDLGCKTVANNMIKGKIAPEIRMTQTPSVLQLDLKLPPSKKSFQAQVRVLHSEGRPGIVHIYPQPAGPGQRAHPVPNVPNLDIGSPNVDIGSLNVDGWSSDDLDEGSN